MVYCCFLALYWGASYFHSCSSCVDRVIIGYSDFVFWMCQIFVLLIKRYPFKSSSFFIIWSFPCTTLCFSRNPVWNCFQYFAVIFPFWKSSVTTSSHNFFEGGQRCRSTILRFFVRIFLRESIEILFLLRISQLLDLSGFWCFLMLLYEEILVAVCTLFWRFILLKAVVYSSEMLKLFFWGGGGGV